jgi:hypothetical protein
MIVWFGLWFLAPLSTLFQLDHGGQFYLWRNSEYPKKTTDLSQVTDKHFVIWLTSISLLSFIVVVNHSLQNNIYQFVILDAFINFVNICCLIHLQMYLRYVMHLNL